MTVKQIPEAIAILNAWVKASNEKDRAVEHLQAAARQAGKLLGEDADEAGWSQIISRLAEEVTWLSLGAESTVGKDEPK